MSYVDVFEVDGQEIFVQDTEGRTLIQENSTEISGVNDSLNSYKQTNDQAVASVNGRCDTLNTRCDTLANKDTELEASIGEANSNISDVRNIVKPIDFSKVLVIGDSFSGDWYEGYKSWYHKFGELCGAETIKAYSYGGSGFVAAGIENVNFADAFTDKVVPNEPNIKDYTLVIVQGGLNDYNQTTDDEKAGVKRLLEKIKTYCPNATIAGLTSISLFQPFRTALFGINDGFSEMGVINTVDGVYWMLGNTSLFADDNLHPNEAGMNFIASAFYNFLCSGSPIPSHTGGFVGGLGGGVIWQMFPGFLQVFAFGNSTATDDTQDIGNIGEWLKPNNYLALPAYSDSGALTFLTFDTDGNFKIFKNDSGAHQLGTWRFAGVIPITLK